MIKDDLIKLNINKETISVDVKPGQSLADLLRESLDLTGTKIGCSENECGICTVLVDGEPILSCAYPAVRAQGKEILTIEGIGESSNNGTDPKLHPIQEAFVQYGAVQCGFCIPGQILTAYALLQKNPNPTIKDIRYDFKDTLCRCAGYPTIERAVMAAAHTMRTGEPLPLPQVPTSVKPLEIIGNLHVRPDSIEKVNGKAIYTDDLKFDGMLYAAVKRTHIPHGTLISLDIEKAKNLEGVEAVLTAKDVPGQATHGLVIHDWPSMIDIGGKVRYVGDSVAIVAARTEEIARMALDLIDAEYKILDPITDPVQANQDDAVDLHEYGNLLKHIKVRKGEMEDGFEEADLILEDTFFTATTDHAFLEPECTIAKPTEDDRMEIYVGSQIPYADRYQVALALGWDEKRVRVIGQLMGGGFGGKEDIAGQIHAALLANETNKPVKLLYDRHESLIAHPKRHATQIKVKMGAKNDGTLTAVKTELYGDTGAYASLGEKVMTRATTHSSGPYEIPNVQADCYAMYTNNPPSGAFRGFGVTQSAFAVETMMDKLAETLKLDPVEIRRINALKVGSTTNTSQLLNDSVGLMECIDLTFEEMQKLSDGDPFISKEIEGSPHIKKSWGLAVAYKNTGLGGGAPDKAGAEVELYTDGHLEVRTSSAELGQGLVTILQMIVAEEFKVSVEKVNVLVMDTDLTPDGGPTTASRQTYVTGNAARLAAQTLREALSTTLAEKFNIPPSEILFIEGLAQVGEQKIELGEVAKIMKQEGREPITLYEYWAPKTMPLGEGGNMHFAFSFAAQAAEVAVNTETGEVKILRIIAATDVGKALNPLGLLGQIEGGVMMAIGNALTEEFIMEDGYIFTDRLARYRIPSITYTPEIIPIIVEDPTVEGPYGAKGIGEIISIPTTPAITNAIYNAVGVRINQLPINQENILLELKQRNNS
ncbi:MAG: molybdopterin-dependent oxidoreductase [Chloroflexi bacterium]|jgi:selenium-dependent xanthine dehydrogenase|nr:molybdopterin-dependent oxidoreductase [Chloroflexota bacterium]MBT4004182.1 molybdopterin-dependent oxidoreductase [Chloroflexota bacterium]MBT4306641.1 molybdopterin-dependent oxidoreductase [Chloroflexota bacterium]MBT4533781.1 molybdopterin-dependent oxidoreductase [Chloroflexota bacterium]MBT4681573.1 molybdopterin-dependent oxidoreductase [Chloroflexota bacterium]